MSLQIPIQKDIGEYDQKIVGKLTLRTLCCLALGFSAAVAVATVLHLGLKVDVSAMTLPIMAAALPFWLAGFCKPYGLPFARVPQLRGDREGLAFAEGEAAREDAPRKTRVQEERKREP